MGGPVPVAYNYSSADAGCWTRMRDIGVPERNDKGQSRNLEWNKQGLVEEEVPAGQEAKSIIDPVPSQPDEAAGHGHVGAHFSNGVVHEGQHDRVQGVRDQETGRAALGEAAANADEEGGSNGATGGNKLDLAVLKPPLEMAHIRVFHMLRAGAVGRVDLGLLLLAVSEMHGC